MSCFIHKSQEGVAVCKQCGKNMCVECSSLVEHSGVCPSCYKPILEGRVQELKETRKELLGSIIGKIILAVLLCWTFVYPLVAIFKLIKMFKQRNQIIPAEIDKLEKKIVAVNNALNEGNANI